MNIIKKEYVYTFNKESVDDAMHLNNAYGETGAGGVASPEREAGFTFVIVINKANPYNGVIFVTTYNEQNFAPEMKKLMSMSFTTFGEPLKPTE